MNQSPNLIIKEAREEDLETILDLYQKASIDNGGSVLEIDKARSIFKSINAYPFYKFYIARLGDEVVGTFSLLIMDNLGHCGAKSGLVEGVAVKLDRQGQGIGKQMMEYAMAVCREHRCYKMSLSSNLKREQAHRFYESLGFTRHGYSYLIDL
jgi:GNAT superfamily N-acetyltransferase